VRLQHQLDRGAARGEAGVVEAALGEHRREAGGGEPAVCARAAARRGGRRGAAPSRGSARRGRSRGS
jgi:hypothetical protein